MISPLPLSFGPRIITSAHMVDRVMYRKPSFRRYGWLRWCPLYRHLRAVYIRRTRRRWQSDNRNWKSVPKKSILCLPNGDLVMHPVMRYEIAKMANCKLT